MPASTNAGDNAGPVLEPAIGAFSWRALICRSARNLSPPPRGSIVESAPSDFVEESDHPLEDHLTVVRPHTSQRLRELLVARSFLFDSVDELFAPAVQQDLEYRYPEATQDLLVVGTDDGQQQNLPRGLDTRCGPVALYTHEIADELVGPRVDESAVAEMSNERLDDPVLIQLPHIYDIQRNPLPGARARLRIGAFNVEGDGNGPLAADRRRSDAVSRLVPMCRRESREALVS